jgi:hypothetical protein
MNIHITHLRRWLVAAAGALLVVGLVSTQAHAGRVNEPDEDHFAFVEPGGPALPLGQVEQIAREQASAAGVSNPVMSVGEGTFIAAKRTIDPSDATPEPTDPGLRSQLERPVFLVVMQGSFTLTNVPLPRGVSGATGSVLDLIIATSNGEVLGRALPEAEQQEETAGVPLASVASRRTIAVHRVTAVAAKGSPPPGIARRIVGRFDGPGEVVVFRGKTVIGRAVPKHGRFVIPIREGTYGIAGRLPSGRYCQGKKVIVPPDHQVSVTLGCRT